MLQAVDLRTAAERLRLGISAGLAEIAATIAHVPTCSTCWRCRGGWGWWDRTAAFANVVEYGFNPLS